MSRASTVPSPPLAVSPPTRAATSPTRPAAGDPTSRCRVASLRCLVSDIIRVGLTRGWWNYRTLLDESTLSGNL